MPLISLSGHQSPRSRDQAPLASPPTTRANVPAASLPTSQVVSKVPKPTSSARAKPRSADAAENVGGDDAARIDKDTTPMRAESAPEEMAGARQKPPPPPAHDTPASEEYPVRARSTKTTTAPEPEPAPTVPPRSLLWRGVNENRPCHHRQRRTRGHRDGRGRWHPRKDDETPILMPHDDAAPSDARPDATSQDLGLPAEVEQAPSVSDALAVDDAPAAQKPKSTAPTANSKLPTSKLQSKPMSTRAARAPQPAEKPAPAEHPAPAHARVPSASVRAKSTKAVPKPAAPEEKLVRPKAKNATVPVPEPAEDVLPPRPVKTETVATDDPPPCGDLNLRTDNRPRMFIDAPAVMRAEDPAAFARLIAQIWICSLIRWGSGHAPDTP
ncbi:hypothetical protein FB451DRAFT_1194101 [Mycena latifolia]|nr:hypothetical protein FB451DRAFT_1194101 [Mycena latifolia]